LQELGVEHEVRWYDKEPFTQAELKRLIGKRLVDLFLNPRSTPYRKLGLADQKVTKTRFISLMLDDPNLLKRPLLVRGTRYIFGLDRETYRSL
jgi:arsenate reductase-like glutaredoxin family protein